MMMLPRMTVMLIALIFIRDEVDIVEEDNNNDALTLFLDPWCLVMV